MEHHYVVYMLRCRDGSYYTGITNHLERRLQEHREGKHRTSYTYSRRPVELVHTASFEWIYDAIAWEKQLKGWNRKKKEALIRGETDKLPLLSKRKRQPL